jgi:glycosyltransferase involved in cell wall biosynthesis
MEEIELSIVMPCLNEVQTIAVCIRKAFQFANAHNVIVEVVVGDNGSIDGSQALALAAGARVINVEPKGYGVALMGAFKACKGKYVIMGDADDSYDFLQLFPFLERLRNGYDVVIGNRFLGGIRPGAMPALNRYLGNPLLSFLGRSIFGSKVGDFHCGLRGFNRESMMALQLKTSGMEFASEMIVEATLKQLKITEVPVVLSKDGRNRPSHLRPWRDGWRHVKFLFGHQQTSAALFRRLATLTRRFKRGS